MDSTNGTVYEVVSYAFEIACCHFE